jgi:hypothetical protein
MAWRPFKKARSFVHGLKLKSSPDWFEYCTSGKKPPDIPTNPNLEYAEWAGYGDWLGNPGRRRGGWQPFKEARAFVHSLDLKSKEEWREYCRSGKKPADIPVYPNETYAEAGWAGTGDWLGYARKRQTSRHVAAERVTLPREEALMAKGL